MVAINVLLVFLVTTLVSCCPISVATSSNKPSKPNILFIFTDDQDARMDSISYMPNVKKYLIDQGTVYRNHYATIAVCCPSRVGLLRGQYAHNTK